MNKTNIEWVKNPDGSQGYTFNPITGCLNHINGICKGGGFPCYAYRLAHGRLRNRYLANGFCAPHPSQTNYELFKDPFYPRFWKDRLVSGYAFMQNHKPMGIFPIDMGDWCGIGIPESWSEWIIEMAKRCSQHRFYLLTKQPQNLIKWSPFPDNCDVGVTATGGEFGWTAAAWIKQIEAKVKFLSVEPFLAPFHNDKGTQDFTRAVIEQFDWLIIGACTGRKNEIIELCKRYPELTPMPYGKIWTAQPRVEWVQEIVEAADKAGIPTFLKDNLKPLLAAEGCPPWAFEKPTDWDIHRRLR